MTSFRSRFLGLFTKFAGKLFRTNDSIEPNESLDRFIPQSNWIRKSDSTVKEVAFLPSEKTKNTSIFRTGGLDPEKIWPIGEEIVLANRPGRRIHGAARIFKAETILHQKLTIIPDRAKHDLHANIESWPRLKEEQLELIKGILSPNTYKLIEND